MQLERYEVVEGMIYLMDAELGINIEEPYSLPFLPAIGEKKGAFSQDLEVVWTYGDEGFIEGGHIKKEGYFHGQFLQLYPSGKVKEESFYKEGKLHGLSYFVSSKGVTLSLTWFHEGLPVGKAKQFYPSGKLYSLQQYCKGKLQGKQEYFYEDGSLKTSLSYKDGLLDGEVKLFWPSGLLKRMSVFEKGLRNGKDLIWNAEGVLVDEGEYKEGCPIGLHRRKYANGLVKEEKCYHSSILFDHFMWDEKGRATYKGIHGENSSFHEVTTVWPEGSSHIRKGKWEGNHVCWE